MRTDICLNLESGFFSLSLADPHKLLSSQSLEHISPLFPPHLPQLLFFFLNFCFSFLIYLFYYFQPQWLFVATHGLLVVVRGLLITVASLVVKHKLEECGLNSCELWALECGLSS